MTGRVTAGDDGVFQNKPRLEVATKKDINKKEQTDCPQPVQVFLIERKVEQVLTPYAFFTVRNT